MLKTFPTIIMETIYSEVVHWRRNCFTVPHGKAGKEFVGELSRLYLAFASASALKTIALKAVTVLPILVLQKPHKASKAKEHNVCLAKRLRSWKEGNLSDLLLEGRAIQRRLPKTPTSKPAEKIARSFANLMFAGKCKATLDLLSDSGSSGLLHLDDHQVSQNPQLFERCLLVSIQHARRPTLSASSNRLLRRHTPSFFSQLMPTPFTQPP